SLPLRLSSNRIAVAPASFWPRLARLDHGRGSALICPTNNGLSCRPGNPKSRSPGRNNATTQREEGSMSSKLNLRLSTAIGAALATMISLGANAWAAGPQIVAGPAADPTCYVPWAAETKFFQYPAKQGPYRIALANGFIANTWRIQMIKTAKAYAAQLDVAKNLKEFKVVSTGEDVAAQIAAINNFIDSGYDAIIVNAQNPKAFGPGINPPTNAGVILVAF